MTSAWPSFERRALILRAARDLFSQRPYAEVPVADIALPEDQRDQVTVDMIADMAAGAFSGGFPALA